MEHNYVISTFFQTSNHNWIRLPPWFHRINDNHTYMCVCNVM
jgi:hypothetical protein